MPTYKSYEKHEHLIGFQIYNWTILDIIADSNRHHTFALAKCKCGTVKEVRLTYIINNKTKDCGCGHKQRLSDAVIKKYEHLIHTKINRWTVLKIIPPAEKTKTYALCQCQCGVVKEVNISYLLNGKSKDCGCGRKETLSRQQSKDLTGQKFGKLLVVERMSQKDKHRHTLYRCRCDCGNEVILAGQLLTTHHTSSCGCLLSYWNMYIQQFLNEHNITCKPEYTIHIDGNYYRFDFYLPEYNLFIEYDGQQHFEPVRFGNQTDEEIHKAFEKTQKHDSIKTKYCMENGHNLLRIPYQENKNIDKIINSHLQRLSEKGSVI